MDKKYLLATALELKPVNKKSADEYNLKCDSLIAKMNAVMLERQDLDSLVGNENISMMKDNHANHVRFIASILKNNNSDVLVDTVLWVFRAYRSHGFSSNYWAAQLNNWIIIIKELLSADSYTEIFPYYEWMQINIPIFVQLSDELIDKSNSMH